MIMNKFFDIYMDLRKKIEHAEFETGSLLPSEKTLSDHYQGFAGNDQKGFGAVVGRWLHPEEAGQRFHRAGHQTVQFPRFRADQFQRAAGFPANPE